MPVVDENGEITYQGRVITETERREIFDWALADEYLKEFVAEGKSYSFLCKIGERYANAVRGNDVAGARANFASRIAPNHRRAGGKVAGYNDGISDLGYFIKWDLKD